MQAGAFWIFMIGIGVAASFLGLVGNVALADRGLDAQIVADQALIDGLGALQKKILTEVQGGKAISIPTTAKAEVCPATMSSCGLYVSISYTVTGESTKTTGATNETAGKLEENATIAEELVGIKEVSTVTDTEGAVLATRARRLTVKVSQVDAEIVAQYDDAADVSTTAVAAQGLAGCDGTSKATYRSTCNADATQAGSATMTSAQLVCQDVPAQGELCNGATPRPADTYSQPVWDDTDATNNGFAR